ncbi:MAG: DegQ family serine endoprotease [Nitrospiraceae bacterium]|nr:MAG: DegQ family serine endoprotease [Nitrospiraceae bacterium]
MKKSTFLIFVLIALVSGYIIGNRGNLFTRKSSVPSYTYNFQTPKGLSGESSAFSEIVKVVSPVVVNISTSKMVERDSQPFPDLFGDQFFDFLEPYHRPKKWKEQSLGSGVIVSAEGYILTNAHVVEKADEIQVTLYDQQNYKGKIIGTDPKTDIAVIKISIENLPAIKWGDSDNISVGEFVLAFGNPFSLSNTVTMGIVSAVGRANVGIADYEDFIQTDAAINPGNSGGPLVNIKGEMIGVNTAIFSRTGGYQGIGFAVPSNMAKSVMTQLINKGRVTRGWLGITIQNFTPELAKEFGLSKTAGALVTEIMKGSPAEKAGLRRGDIITEIDSKGIKNVESLRNTIAQSNVGSTIELTVVRDGKTMTINATITEFPQDLAQAVPKESEEAYSYHDNALAGFSVMNMTQEIAKQLGLSKDEKGVVIVKVEPYTAAEDAGLRKGDIIQEINKKTIKNISEFNSIVSKVKKGDTLLLFINRGGNKFYITLKVYS